MSNNTKELITILREVSSQTQNNSNKNHPFYEYIKEHNDKVKGWIDKQLPKNSINDLITYVKFIFINQYNLLADFLEISGSLKNWQKHLYHAYGITKWTSNWIL